MTKPQIKRSGERLIRLAYDLQMLASRLRAWSGFESEAHAVADLARKAGTIGRRLDEKLRPSSY